VSRRISLRTLMIAIALIALGLGIFEVQVLRKARLAAAQQQRQADHVARYTALLAWHQAQIPAWRRCSADYDAAMGVATMAIHRWRDVEKVRDASDLERRSLAEVSHWLHPDPDDFFPIVHGPSDQWDRRLEAHRALAAQCRAMALYHVVHRGLCFHASVTPFDSGVFAKELAEPPPVVDPYPPAFRAEYDAMPLPRRPAVELIPTNPDGITRTRQ